MAEKPTYTELEQTVKRLENEVAKRKRAEKALESHGGQLTSIFDGIDEPIYICDPDTHELLYANAATTALFGPDLVGQKCYRVFQGLDEPLLHREVAGNNVSMKLELPSGLPPVSGDRVELQQVVVNLVVNAREAMRDLEPDSRELVISTFTDQSNNVVVAVRDSGSGFDRKVGDRIFDPFYTTKSEGLGMGLAISRTIIEAHGGSLWGTNNPDRGATFYFTVPISDGGEA